MIPLVRSALVPLMVLAASGFALSLVAHVSALLGFTPLGSATWALHQGLFAVWLPAILLMRDLTSEVKQKDLWRAALRGCPRWMRWGGAGRPLVTRC